MNVDLSEMPEDWWLHYLGEERSPVRYKGDEHEPGPWIAAIQHKTGGRLSKAYGSSPQEAVTNAIIHRREP